ncbi:GNAT family N-acetyltransferase [Iningainema sp. BLCCT55]|uniref:GNAT family N-acetyltransferase n=2 Tax=Iningainema TaxID=1932705 RepID=A0A8J7CGM9_9CYAN|nr:GNAT family N-acetyltransferase [Iningainema tapete BLCC-T55]
MLKVTYKTNLENVDWTEMKATLQADAFDNGRSPKQLKDSFENSYATCIAYIDNQIIGTARVLSDGICNAYVVDVWTLSNYRRQGIGRTIMQILLEKLKGQHVYLFTNDVPEFYKKIGFTEQPIGMSQVVGRWLVNK